jgi:dipeptidyl aminopeptidase/acylaminoacyl peptidase
MLTPELLAQGAVSLSYAAAADGQLCWIEGRPAEGGRSVLMRRTPAGSVQEVLGPGTDVRSRVHEYGGMPWLAAGGGLVYGQFSDQRLRLFDAQSQTTLLTPVGCRYADGCAAPDGHTLVIVREDHRAGGEARNEVVVIDLRRPGDAGRLLYGDSDFVAWPRLNADGSRLALIAWNHPDMPWDSTRLLAGTLADGGFTAPVVVAGGAGESVLEPRWDSDGSLYFLSDRSGHWRLYRWCDGLLQGPLEPATGPRLPAQAELGGPLWQLGASSYALTGDGRALLRVSVGTVDSLMLLDLHTLALRVLDLPFIGFDSIGLVSATEGFALAAAAGDLPALITFDLQSGRHRVVRRAGVAPLAPAWLSRPQAIEFVTQPGPQGDARTAHAWFYAPCNPLHAPLPAEKPPLVVTLHGGPTSRAGPAYKGIVQFWTTRGFAVVDVNYGGSTGYGRAYRERLRGEWGSVDLADAVAAVDHLVAQGAVDGQRVVIRGGSAGGFTVLSALAFTSRFAAGINYYGVADLETLAADTHKFESRYLDSLVAPYPAGAEIYRQRSPVHHMGQCRAALITFQGLDDKAVPPAQSRDIVAATRVAGCPVAFLEFAGEGHGFRQATNIVRAFQAELVFLGRVFGYTPAGDLPALDIDNPQALPGRQ